MIWPESANELNASDPPLLADLVDEIAERLQRDEDVDITLYISRHPGLEPELRAAYESLVGVRHFLQQGDAAAADAEPKQLGDYRLLHEIGRGGMGVVYEAEQLSLSRRVALKVLPFAALLDQRQLERFKNESRAAAMLKHPNIVSVFSVGCERGVHYYAMELVEGQSLAHIIEQLSESNRGEPLESEVFCGSEQELHAAGHELASPSRRSASNNSQPIDTETAAALSTARRQNRKAFYRSVAQLGSQVAQALHAAHQEGVVHRDVKPSNLLIDRDGKVWITDFGLARIQADEKLTMTGDLLGTLRYMSPEQADPARGVLDHRTDIYSLGISLYELLTLKPAFGGKDPNGLLKAIAEREPASPRSLDPEIPRDLETIVLKASAKEVAGRYATAADVADDLERFLEQRPIAARRSTRFQILWRWAERNRALAVASSLAMCLLLLLAIAGPLMALRQTQLSKARLADLYAAEMQKALDAYQRGDFLLVNKTLQRYSSDDKKHLRGFEWYCLWQHTRRQLLAPTRWNNIIISSVDVAPDDRTFVLANWWGSIECCDAETMEPIWRVSSRDANGPGHDDWVLAMAHAPDGKMIATGGRDKWLKLWDAETGELLAERECPRAVSALDISIDNLLAIGLSHDPFTIVPTGDVTPVEVLLFEIRRDAHRVDLVEAENRLDGCVNVVHNLRFSPDGKLLAAGSDDSQPLVWRVADWRRVGSFDDAAGPVLDVDFSPDSSRLATAGGIFDGRWIAGHVTVADASSGQTAWRKRTTSSRVTSVDYSAQSDMVVTGAGDGVIRVFNADDGQPIETIRAHAHVVRDVCFAHQSDALFSAGYDDAVRRWNIRQDAPTNMLTGHADEVLTIDISSDSQWLVTASPRGVKLWDVQTGRLWKQLDLPVEHFSAAAFAPGSNRLVVGGGPFPIDDQAPAYLGIWDSKWGMVHQQITGLVGKVWTVSFSPDGKRMLTAGYHQTPTIWNVASGAIEAELDGLSTHRVWFSRDGNYIAGLKGRFVDLWDANGLNRVRRIDVTDGDDDAGSTHCIAFSADGKLFAVAGWGSVITLWSLPDCRHVGTLAGHRQTVLSLDFSPDGRRLASGSCDKTVRIWNVDSKREVMTFRDHPGWIWAVKFSPDGRTLAIGSSADAGHDTLSVWRAATEEDVQAAAEEQND